MKLSVYVLGCEVTVVEWGGDFKSVLNYISNAATDDFVFLTLHEIAIHGEGTGKSAQSRSNSSNVELITRGLGQARTVRAARLDTDEARYVKTHFGRASCFP